MKAVCNVILFVALVGVFFLALVVANQEPQPVQEPAGNADLAKKVIELPLELVILEESSNTDELTTNCAERMVHDMSKGFIEAPIEGMLVLNPELNVDADANPIVEPGKVDWHADLATARDLRTRNVHGRVESHGRA